MFFVEARASGQRRGERGSVEMWGLGDCPHHHRETRGLELLLFIPAAGTRLLFPAQGRGSMGSPRDSGHRPVLGVL